MSVTTCGTVIRHTTAEVDAWVNVFMAVLEARPEQRGTLILGLSHLIIITESGIIWMGDTPETVK